MRSFVRIPAPPPPSRQVTPVPSTSRQVETARPGLSMPADDRLAGLEFSAPNRPAWPTEDPTAQCVADGAPAGPKSQETGRFDPLADVRMPNRTGLPDRLKANVEALSGLSMDDVRVHRNSPKPAQMQALAYAQGTEIHLGPGQERHLPHEAWHVVQQKQGRVQPTMQVGELLINDSKSLEREADDATQKSRSLRYGGSGPHPAPNPKTIQRKVGFEFETIGKSFEITGSNKASKKDPKIGIDFKSIKYTKIILLKLSPLGSGLAADNGHAEFVTKPIDNYSDVTNEIAPLTEFCARVIDEKQKDHYDFTPEENSKMEAISKYRFHRAKLTGTGNGDPRAKMQATFGVKFIDVERFSQNIIERAQDNILKRRDNAVNNQEKRDYLTRNKLYNQLKWATEQARKVASKLSAQGTSESSKSEERISNNEDHSSQQLIGFFTIIFKTIADAADLTDSISDPKYAFSMMPRNDFVTMLKSLDDKNRELLKTHSNTIVNDIIDSGLPDNKSSNDDLFANTYKMAVDPKTNEEFIEGVKTNKQNNIKTRDWLNSIFDEKSPIDLLSPPPGYEPHAYVRSKNRDPEGLGAYDMDAIEDSSGNKIPLALFELRSLNDGSEVARSEWLRLAQDFATFVGVATNDPKLRPGIEKKEESINNKKTPYPIKK